MRCGNMIGSQDSVVIVDVRGVTVTSRAVDPELSRAADAGAYHYGCYHGPVVTLPASTA